MQRKGKFGFKWNKVFGFSETKSSLISNYSLMLQLCSVFGNYTQDLQPQLGSLSTGIPTYFA